MDKNNKLTSK